MGNSWPAGPATIAPRRCDRGMLRLTSAKDGPWGQESGSGWESNPPGLLLQHPSDGFEDRGAHRDSTTPVSVRISCFPDFVKSSARSESSEVVIVHTVVALNGQMWDRELAAGSEPVTVPAILLRLHLILLHGPLVDSERAGRVPSCEARHLVDADVLAAGGPVHRFLKCAQREAADRLLRRSSPAHRTTVDVV